MAVGAAVASWSGAQPVSPAAPGEDFSRLQRQVEELESTDVDQAFAVAHRARAVARTPGERLRADLLLAGLQRQRGEYDPALAAARTGLAAAMAAGDDVLRAEFLLLVGRIQWNRSELPASLQTLQELAPLAEKLDDARLLARLHNALGNTQATSGNLDRSRGHFESARTFAEQAGDRALLADILNNLGNFHLNRRKDYAVARDYHTQALALREALGHRRGFADSHLNLGVIANAQGDHAEAIVRYERALEIYESLGLKRNLANTLRSLGVALRLTGRAQESLTRLERARSLAESLGSPAVLAPIYRELAATHDALGDWRTALDFERKYFASNDAMLNERIRQQVVTLNERSDAERHQREMALLRREQVVQEAELAQARRQRLGFIAIIGLVAVAVVALVSRHRLKLAAERRVLSETRAAKEAAERADALKTRLVGIASHDLKSPLRAMIAATETITRNPGDTAAVVLLSRRLHDEGQRMFGLIRDLLDMAALETGRLELHCGLLDFGALTRQLVDDLQPRAAAKLQPLTLATDPDATGLWVTGDPARLRQVLENLVDNALKFTPPRGAVHVSVGAEPGAVRVAVRDEGPGLSPEDCVAMFQPFRTLSAQPTAGEPSSGLGLYIAREIVSAHGGQLVVDSVPGEGATFAVLLPPAARAPAVSGSG